MLSVTELVVGERALVVGAGVSNRLGADDPELAEVIDQLVGSGLDGTNYVGGYPHWVQHAASNAPLSPSSTSTASASTTTAGATPACSACSTCSTTATATPP
ncbi:MAG: hypothetical protein R3B48_28835 [Kofleriaceae bacterium]